MLLGKELPKFFCAAVANRNISIFCFRNEKFLKNVQRFQCFRKTRAFHAATVAISNFCHLLRLVSLAEQVTYQGTTKRTTATGHLKF